MKRLYFCMDFRWFLKRWRERGVVVEINTLDVLGSVGGLASAEFLIVLGTTLFSFREICDSSLGFPLASPRH